ncbi:hypothetical protein CC85DRAFT_68393 [Cutaneotrichosporon oleaginosum]|uniref:Uncharacterized protein n=1 Tax=Cutaneotrichosporon oleaginosum TaxID=879819 RepID=A0A0J0XPX8_9TREE|nr:uncharacterized protein CC85DRAFT_68393 [Cutaneotrichosporon oleaginosum]KLT43132.1 hypothetical protein CC85DRAFT_68393 [Cutaneotrichosporon oleaginosum]TXT10059.1 hypothetical protein COLE_03993 [Cutaneotrichosporon oleaginosum]
MNCQAGAGHRLEAGGRRRERAKRRRPSATPPPPHPPEATKNRVHVTTCPFQKSSITHTGFGLAHGPSSFSCSLLACLDASSVLSRRDRRHGHGTRRCDGFGGRTSLCDDWRLRLGTASRLEAINTCPTDAARRQHLYAMHLSTLPLAAGMPYASADGPCRCAPFRVRRHERLRQGAPSEHSIPAGTERCLSAVRGDSSSKKS